MKPDKEHLLSFSESGSNVTFHFKKFSYLAISFFLQPLRSLIAYERFRNHQTFMKLPQVLYGILPPLQDSSFQWFSDRLEGVIQQLNAQNLNQPFLQCIMSVFKDQLIYYYIVIQVCVIIKMTVSYILGYTIKLIQEYIEGKVSFNSLLGYSGALSALLILAVIIEQHYFQNIYQVSMKIRFAITGLLYRKLHQTTQTRIKEVSKGQFFNIISIDLTEIDSGLTWFIAFMGSIVVGILGIIILYGLKLIYIYERHFKYYCFIGLISLVGIILLQRQIVAYSTKFKSMKNSVQDERTKLTEEVLQNIRTLKLYGQEHTFRNMLVRKRDEQDGYARKIVKLDALAQSVGGNISVFLSLILMIISYVQIGNGELGADKIFGSLWVLQLIKVWCITYYYRAYKFWTNMKLVERRIQEILALKDVIQVSYDGNLWKEKKMSDKDSKIQMVEEEDMSIKKTEEREIALIRIINYTAHWSKEQQQPVLSQINFEVVRDQGEGRLICIVGQIGSGKTSLLLSILQEIPVLNGKIEVIGSIAYVEQDPYIFPGTVQSNILFGLEYDHLRYKWALNVSQLETDLLQLERNDQTEVGEKGVRLSGGQKARLSFCRAIYSKAQIFLLDDMLSAVDTKVGGLLFHEGILELKKQGKIVMFVTHQLQWAMYCDRVIQLNGGKIVNEAQGISAIQSLIASIKQMNQNDSQQSYSQPENDIILQSQQTQTDQYSKYNLDEEQPIQYEQEDVIPPVIPIDVYKKYVQEGGGTSLIIIISLLYITDASLNLAVNKAFGQWASDGSRFSLVIILSSLYLMTNYLKLVVLYRKTLNIISNMHRKLSASVTRATVRYFDITPIGLILARFTSDLSNIEAMVMLDCHWVLEGLIDNIYIILIVSVQNPTIILVSTLLLLWMFWVKSHFHDFMKYATKCDDQTRGQLFSFIQSQTNGSTVIRSYGQASYFYTEFLRLQYQNMQSYFTFLRLNALVGFAFDFSLHLLIILSLFSILIFQVKDKQADPANIGFGLLMLLSLGYMFSLNLRGQIYLDIDMQNAYRVFKSIEAPQEDAVEYDQDYELILRSWPQNGQIIFKNVSVCYNKDIKKKQYALKNISFQIESGKSIGIVGRTGAGKTSLIQALFRTVELDSGRIEIDSVDIDTVGLHTLREKIEIIPQNAPILSISIRDNLDPKHLYTDEQIWKAIEKVKLTDVIGSIGLTTVAAGTQFSAGQKQLFCLCRVLLNENAKILVFDEATSNMDQVNDQLVIDLINEHFKNVTRLIIAHRLMTVVNCDSIMVLDKGEIVEIGNAYELISKDLQIKNGFKAMVECLPYKEQDEIFKEVSGMKQKN